MKLGLHGQPWHLIIQELYTDIRMSAETMDKIDKEYEKEGGKKMYKARLKVLSIFVSSKEQQSRKMIAYK